MILLPRTQLDFLLRTERVVALGVQVPLGRRRRVARGTAGSLGLWAQINVHSGRLGPARRGSRLPRSPASLHGSEKTAARPSSVLVGSARDVHALDEPNDGVDDFAPRFAFEKTTRVMVALTADLLLLCPVGLSKGIRPGR
jgi:hypothetical protein